MRPGTTVKRNTLLGLKVKKSTANQTIGSCISIFTFWHWAGEELG